LEFEPEVPGKHLVSLTGPNGSPPRWEPAWKNPRTKGKVKIRDPDGKLVGVGKIDGPVDGPFDLTFTPLAPRPHVAEISLNGEPLADIPVTVHL